MPILWLLLGILICGLKFPFNFAFPEGGEVPRKQVLNETQWGLKSGDPNIEDALARIRAPGRTSHDLTNLPIEVFAWQFAQDDPRLRAWTVKAWAAALVYPWLLFLAFKLIRIFW